MNPYHDSEGKFTTAEGAASASPTGREFLYRRRDLHADGTWPAPERARPQFATVPGSGLLAGEKAHGADGAAYLVTQAAARRKAGKAVAAGVPDDSWWEGVDEGGSDVAMGRVLGKSGRPEGPELELRGTFRVELPSREPRKAYGGVVFDPLGRVLLREPAGHYDGYVWTFPKGGQEPGDSALDTARKEVAEETGHDAKVVGHVPGVFRSTGTSASYYFLMHSRGHDPRRMDGETKSLRWATPEEARRLIGLTANRAGRERDLAVLEAALEAYSRLPGAAVARALREGTKRPLAPA